MPSTCNYACKGSEVKKCSEKICFDFYLYSKCIIKNVIVKTCYHVKNQAVVRSTCRLIDSLNCILLLIYKISQSGNRKHVAKSKETMHRSDIVNCLRFRNNANNDQFQAS